MVVYSSGEEFGTMILEVPKFSLARVVLTLGNGLGVEWTGLGAFSFLILPFPPPRKSHLDPVSCMSASILSYTTPFGLSSVVNGEFFDRRSAHDEASHTPSAEGVKARL